MINSENLAAIKREVVKACERETLFRARVVALDKQLREITFPYDLWLERCIFHGVEDPNRPQARLAWQLGVAANASKGRMLYYRVIELSTNASGQEMLWPRSSRFAALSLLQAPHEVFRALGASKILDTLDRSIIAELRDE